MDKEDLDNIRKNLPQGFLKILAKKTGKTVDSVSKALRGVINSEIIVNEAVKLAKRTKRQKDNLKRDLEEL